jgi:hypothetical protein
MNLETYDKIIWTGTNLPDIQSFIKKQTDTCTLNRPGYKYLTSYQIDGGVLEINFTTTKEDGPSMTIVYHLSKGNVLAYDTELAWGTFTVLEVEPEAEPEKPKVKTPANEVRSQFAETVDEVVWKEFVSDTNLYNFRAVISYHVVGGDSEVGKLIRRWFDRALHWIVRPFNRDTCPETITANSVIYQRLTPGEKLILDAKLVTWANEPGGFYAKLNKKEK